MQDGGSSRSCGRQRQPPPHLMHAVQELQEDGRETAALAGQRLGTAVAEAVAK